MAEVKIFQMRAELQGIKQNEIGSIEYYNQAQSICNELALIEDSSWQSR